MCFPICGSNWWIVGVNPCFTPYSLPLLFFFFLLISIQFDIVDFKYVYDLIMGHSTFFCINATYYNFWISNYSIFQEITSAYRILSSPELVARATNNVCNALALLQVGHCFHPSSSYYIYEVFF